MNQVAIFKTTWKHPENWNEHEYFSRMFSQIYPISLHISNVRHGENAIGNWRALVQRGQCSMSSSLWSAATSCPFESSILVHADLDAVVCFMQTVVLAEWDFLGRLGHREIKQVILGESKNTLTEHSPLHIRLMAWCWSVVKASGVKC